MLADSLVATRLPVTDLERARRFYSEKLGLEPIEERPGGLCYRCGGGYFALFESTGTASGDHTQMAWEVANLETTVAALRARGVVFEEYDLPGLKTVNGIAEIEGNYPSKGVGERGAWFRDSEGNLLGLGQAVDSAKTDGPSCLSDLSDLALPDQLPIDYGRAYITLNGVFVTETAPNTAS
jgi:catechol 2,3-dioxygenase-like lactoylglutathione lyase family enzyme